MKRALTCLSLSLVLVACEEIPAPVVPTPPTASSVAPPPSATAVAAQPADPPATTEKDITIGWANGMQILIKRIPGSEMSSAQLYLRGGVRNWGARDAGIEALGLATLTSGGTTTLDKDAFARRLAELGSEIGGGTTADYSVVSAKCLTQAWDATFTLLADAFLNPALPAAELEVQRQRQLSGLRHEQESPDGSLRLAVHRGLFVGHPYANRAVGTPESVAALKLDDVRAELGKLRETRRMLLVVVGDVDPAHIIQQANRAFGALPRGSYQEDKLPPITFAASRLTTEDRKLPTNYIQAVFPAPGVGDAEYPAATVAMNMLGDRLFKEVRTKRNLSYAPGARLSSNLSIGLGALYVTAVDPNTTMKVMYDELRRLQTDLVPEKELTASKALFLTGYLMDNEATDSQGAILARAQLVGGDFRLARDLPERIRAVTAAEVQAFARKYAVHLQATVLGDPSKIDKGLFESM